MTARLKHCSPIEVCVGAGCKAWDSELLMQNLKIKNLQINQGTNIFPAKCMNNCGGGVTVKISLFKEILKIKNANKIWEEILKKVQQNNNCRVTKR